MNKLEHQFLSKNNRLKMDSDPGPLENKLVEWTNAPTVFCGFMSGSEWEANTTRWQ